MRRLCLLLVLLLAALPALAKTAPPAPLTGTVTTQTWTSYDQAFSGIALQSGKPFHFNVLPPAQYNGTAYQYPLYIWLHPDFEGQGWYSGSNSDPLQLVDCGLGCGLEAPYYNQVSFLTAYPAFIVVPYADQTSGNDAVENWGGWCNNGTTGSGTNYSGDTGPNTFALLKMITYLESQYSIDPSRIYVNGFSLGGIGAEYLMLHYNGYNGDLGKVFAAGASTGGVLQINGCGASNVTMAQSNLMKTVPVWWFSGAQDTTSYPSEWNDPMWQALAGNSTYPQAITSASANQAGTTSMRYTLCPSCGHQDTDANGNPVWTNTTINSFLFAQSTGSTPTPPPTPTGAYTWTVTSGGQVAVNGVVDTTTANVVALSYVGGSVWQETSSGQWYSKATPSATWAAGSDPLPMPVEAAADGYIYLAYGPTITLGTTPNPTSSYPEIGTGSSNNANWVPYTFDGTAWRNIGVTANSNGSVTLNGTGQAYGNGLATAVAGNPSAGTTWQGAAFGGGGYFQATMAFTGPVAFWANDIETQNGISIGGGPNPWPGQAAGYGDWIETDFAEFDSTNVYGFAIHNWYNTVGYGGTGVAVSTVGSGSPVSPPGAVYTNQNTYGWLWVPASASSTGLAKNYFNGSQVGNNITWNQYNSSLPPPPTQNSAGTGGGSAYSILDTLHLYMILGAQSGGGDTNTIYNVSVWQKSFANDIFQGETAPTIPTPVAYTSPNYTTILAGSSSSIQTPTTSPGTGNFQISNGQILSPSGSVFIPKGEGFIGSANSDATSITSASQITNLFPGTNIVMFYDYSYSTPSTYETQVNALTAAGIVVVIGNAQNFDSAGNYAGGYGSGCGDIFQGSILTTESNWYASMASYYKSNPYVWFTTNNEPSYVTGTTGVGCGQGTGTPNLPLLATWEQATYNAIRGAGNTSIVMMEEPAGGNPGTVGLYTTYGGVMTPSVYAAMTNVIWNLHFYGGGVVPNGTSNTNQSQVNASLLGSAASSGSFQGQGILAAQTIGSADGTMPVFIGEFGPSTTGASLDPNGQNVVIAVTTLANGSPAVGGAAWEWAQGGGSCYPGCDTLVINNATAVTSPYGSTVAAWTAQNTPSESLHINTVATQTAGIPFTVTGSIVGLTSAPTLQYSNNGGAYQNLPSGSSVNASTFSFTNPGLTANTAATVSVRDANNTSVVATSNSFSVSSSGSGPVGIRTPANLISYLNSITGHGVISGQYTENKAGSGAPYNFAPIQTIQSTTQQWLGMIGCDAMISGTTTIDNSCSSYSIPYWQAGGLVEVNWYAPNPADNGLLTDLTVPTGGWAAVLTAGTTANTNFIANLNALVPLLQSYQTAGVVVLFRPYIEMNGNWNWWATNSGGYTGGKGSGTGGASGITNAQFIAIWQYTYNYLVVTKGLNNLVWLYTPNACGGGTCDTATYPGAGYADVVGYDIYSDTPGQASQGDYGTMLTLGKPIVLGEFGPGSASCGDPSFDERVLISQLQTYAPNAVLWQQWWSGNTVSTSCPTGAGWGMDTLTNTTDLTTALNNPYVINRGGIYCTTCGGGTASTVTWNPGDTSATITLSNNNLTASGNANITATAGTTRDTLYYSAGSYCFEGDSTTMSTNWSLGIANAAFNTTAAAGLGADGNGIGFYPVSPTQAIYYAGVGLSYGATASASGDVVTECVNFGTSQFWVTDSVMRSAGQTWNNSTTANPATGTGGFSFSGLTCPCYIAFNTKDTPSAVTLNTSGPFAVSIPSGFSVWQPAVSQSHHVIQINLGSNDNHPPAANDGFQWYMPVSYEGRH